MMVDGKFFKPFLLKTLKMFSDKVDDLNSVINKINDKIKQNDIDYNSLGWLYKLFNKQENTKYGKLELIYRRHKFVMQIKELEKELLELQKILFYLNDDSKVNLTRNSMNYYGITFNNIKKL